MVILEGTYSDEENTDGTYKYPDHMSQLTNYVQSLNSDVNDLILSLSEIH